MRSPLPTSGPCARNGCGPAPELWSGASVGLGGYPRRHIPSQPSQESDPASPRGVPTPFTHCPGSHALGMSPGLGDNLRPGGRLSSPGEEGREPGIRAREGWIRPERVPHLPEGGWPELGHDRQNSLTVSSRCLGCPGCCRPSSLVTSGGLGIQGPRLPSSTALLAQLPQENCRTPCTGMWRGFMPVKAHRKQRLSGMELLSPK